MSAVKTFPLSGEILLLLRENMDFFQSVAEHYPETGLGIRGVDGDARVERRERVEGGVEIGFVYGLDDNAEASDGRLYFADQFIFDSNLKFQNFRRQFSSNDLGEIQVWQARLKRYQQDNPPIAQETARRFATRLARRFAAEPTQHSIHPALLEALRSQAAYLQKAAGGLHSIGEGFRLKITDPQSHYAVELVGEEIRLKFSWIAGAEEDADGGMIFLEEHYVLDREHRLKSVKRVWLKSPEVAQDLGAILHGLNAAAQPELAEAEVFVRAMLPSLELPTIPTPMGHQPADPPTPEPPENFSKGWQARLARQNDRAKALREAAGILQAIVEEQCVRRLDRSLGWWTSGSVQDLEADKAREVLFEKLFQRILDPSGPDLRAALLGLSLNQDESRLRERILQDPLFEKISSISGEADVGFRAQQYLHFARRELLGEEELFQAAVAVEKIIGHEARPYSGDADSLELLISGGASFGRRVEFLLPQVAKRVADPWMLGAMAAAGLAGPTSEFLGLTILRPLGVWSRPVSGLFGIGGEALAFTSVSKVAETAVGDPRRALASFWSDSGSAALLFGSLRVAHWGTGRLGESLRLSRGWKGSLHHAGGVLGVWGGEELSGLWDPHPVGFFDSMVIYFQASMGFNLANRASGGSLSSTVREWKLRLAATPHPALPGHPLPRQTTGGQAQGEMGLGERGLGAEKASEKNEWEWKVGILEAQLDSAQITGDLERIRSSGLEAAMNQLRAEAEANLGKLKSEAESEIHALTASHHLFQMRINELTLERNRALEKLEELQNPKTLQLSEADVVSSSWENEVEGQGLELRKFVEKMKGQLAVLQVEREGLWAENEHLRASSQALQKELMETRGQLGERQEELGVAQARWVQLADRLVHPTLEDRAQAEQFTNSVIELQRELQGSQAKVERLLAQFRQEKQLSEYANAEAASRILHLQSVLKAREVAFNAVEAQFQKARAQLDQFRIQYAQDIAQMQPRFDELKRLLREREGENEELRTQSVAREAKIFQLEEDVEKLQHNLGRGAQEVEVLMKELAEEIKGRDVLEGWNEELNRHLKVRTEELERLRWELRKEKEGAP